jgi:AraC-like DNA-binding protein
MNFLETIFLFFSFQATFLACLFFLKKKGDKIANVIFGVYLLLFAYNIFFNVLFWSNKLFTRDFISLLFTNIATWILYGPILYLYIRRAVTKKKFRLSDIIHFVPFLLYLINFSPYFLADIDRKMVWLKEDSWTDKVYYFSPHFIKIYIGIMLLYFSLIIKFLKNNLTSLNNKRWLTWLVFSYLGYVISFTSFFILKYYGFIEMGYDYFIGFLMIFFIGLVTFFSFMQPSVFSGLSMDKVIPFIKYQRTGLTKKYSLELKFKLLTYMQSDKPYLNSELRLDDLAEKLNLSRHHTSQIINEHFDSSFFDFINHYRIGEAKKLLRNDHNLNITEVLYACGFNNRVSFYKAFKKFTGVTPTGFKLGQKQAY